MKSVRREKRKGSSGWEIYADVFETVLFSFFLLTVGAVCGRRGVGWISRKKGWDAQTEGEKRGGTHNTVSYCGGRSWQTVRGGSGLYEAEGKGTEGG